ncbi:ubiquitin-related modifier 1 [Apiospora arundinis]
MQRRNSTKPGGLNRRKSTSSIKSVQLLHISTEQAERDARVAATQAFRQARDRSATESSLWPPSRMSNRPSLDRYYSSPDRRSNESASCKQQSVRFVKPKLSGGLAQLRRQHEKTPSRTSTKARPRTSENSSPGLWLPTDIPSTSILASDAKGTTGDYIKALITGEEYYTPEDNIASEPSSYRRIRKSKSLFSSFDGPSSGAREPGRKLSENISPPNLGSPYYQPVENIPPTELKTPKSMSFLKSRREQRQPLPTRRESMPLVTRAVNIIPLGSTSLQSASSHTSHKSGKVLRRSLRDTSDTTESGSADTANTSLKDKGITKKARKVSHGLKSRIKGFFNLSKFEANATVFPPQQIEAQKTHVVEVETEDPIAPDALLEDAALSRVTSGVPSLHAVPSEQQLRSQQVSLESLRSERKVSDEKSRVTSWTNSDVLTSTVTSNQGREWERQRLSVIKENGPHISSSAFRRTDLARQWTDKGPFANFPTEEASVDPSANVDSQRIYSALMKRLNEAQQASRTPTSHGLEQGSADDAASLRSSLAPTIRHVVSDDDIGQELTEAETDSASAEDSGPDSRSSNSQDCVVTSQINQEEHPTIQVGQSEEPPRVRTLSARPSAFFGSPTCHLFRTQSPYRRALQSSISTATDQVIASPRSSDFSPFMPSLNNFPIRSVSRCDSDTDGKLNYSESIYSNEGLDSRPTSDTLPLVDRFPSPPRNHGNHGAVTIFVDPPKPQIPVKSHRRLTSTASSVEWKTWLSANISKLEDSALSGDFQGGEQDLSLTRFPPASGHLREKAQISDCDDQEENTEPPIHNNPEEILEDAKTTTSNNGHQQRSALANTDDLADKENQPPPIPVKSALRSIPSATSLGSSTERSNISTYVLKENAKDTGTPKPLTHTRSANALGPRSQNPAPSPVKLIRRQQKPAKNTTHVHTSSIGEAVERQFGKVIGSPSPNRGPTKMQPRGSKNVNPRRVLKSERSEGQSVGFDGPGENLDPQAMGSKQMVDLFLSSRRRRIAGSEEGHESAFV